LRIGCNYAGKLILHLTVNNQGDKKIPKYARDSFAVCLDANDILKNRKIIIK
jgi:hypothetical protein